MMKITEFEQDGVRVFWLHIGELGDSKVFQEYYGQLSGARRSKVDRQRTDKGRRLSLGAGILQDAGLKEYGLRERGVRISTKENGKPFLLDYPEIHFNLSHSREMVMASFAGSEVGCDIEYEGVLKLQIAKRFFCPDEYEYIVARPEAERKEIFYRLWTLKESFMKATGLGMRLMPNRFEFQFAPGKGRGHKERIGTSGACPEGNVERSVGECTAESVNKEKEEYFRYTQGVTVCQHVNDKKYQFMEYFYAGYHMAVCVEKSFWEK